jgi:molybdenum-dependent DNA-binding transcriptional regulator ModE
VKPKLRVWVAFPTGLKFGDGRAEFLEAIDELGSLRSPDAPQSMMIATPFGEEW